jgi:hypothetical protein
VPALLRSIAFNGAHSAQEGEARQSRIHPLELLMATLATIRVQLAKGLSELWDRQDFATPFALPFAFGVAMRRLP